jgi:hypothetical protein
MIVYLMTLAVSGTMAARAILLTAGDCDTLAKRIAGNDPLYAGKPYSIQCEALPMYVGTKGCQMRRNKLSRASG